LRWVSKNTKQTFTEYDNAESIFTVRHHIFAVRHQLLAVRQKHSIVIKKCCTFVARNAENIFQHLSRAFQKVYCLLQQSGSMQISLSKRFCLLYFLINLFLI